MRILAWLLALAVPVAAAAEEPRATVEFRSLFYGDNTEFLSNPYRDGETMLGAALRLDGTYRFSDNARLRLGVQTDSRAGDREPFRRAWPVVALEVGGASNRFIMGTLQTGAFSREPKEGLWPDESGLHALVPPLHLDTRALGGYEAGLQWLRTGDSLTQDVWIAWRRLNTASQREKFDAGYNGRLVLFRVPEGSVSLMGQGHIVHEGGQLTHEGSVGDSMAGGPGVRVDQRFGPGTVRTEVFQLFSKHNPDREDRNRPDRLDGYGRFLRLSYAWNDWRAAWLYWHHSRRFIKWDGDPNFGVLLNDDTTDGPVVGGRERTYHEFSVSRRFMLGDDAALLANGRLYRIDGSWDYAYRVLASIRIGRSFGGR